MVMALDARKDKLRQLKYSPYRTQISAQWNKISFLSSSAGEEYDENLTATWDSNAVEGKGSVAKVTTEL